MKTALSVVAARLAAMDDGHVELNAIDRRLPVEVEISMCGGRPTGFEPMVPVGGIDGCDFGLSTTPPATTLSVGVTLPETENSAPRLLTVPICLEDVARIEAEIGPAQIEHADNRLDVLGQREANTRVLLFGDDRRKRLVAVGSIGRRCSAFLKSARISGINSGDLLTFRGDRAIVEKRIERATATGSVRNDGLFAEIGLRQAETDFADVLPAPVIGDADRRLLQAVMAEFAKIEDGGLAGVVTSIHRYAPGPKSISSDPPIFAASVAAAQAEVDNVQARAVRNALRQPKLAAGRRRDASRIGEQDALAAPVRLLVHAEGWRSVILVIDRPEGAQGEDDRVLGQPRRC